MACALVTKTCANLATNHMKTQNDRDLDTCVRSSARFPWFRVEFCFALISCCKRKQCPIILFGCCEYFDLKLKFGHFQFILFATLLLQWFLKKLPVEVAATIGEGQDPGNFY